MDERSKGGGGLSLNSLQLAIISLKEKCEKQQKRLDEIEGEKDTLNASKETLYTEVKKLHEANVKLRDKNLQLSHDLQRKSVECSELNRRLEDSRMHEAMSSRQIERLQSQVAVIAHRESSDVSSLVSISEEATESLPPADDTGRPPDLNTLIERLATNQNRLRSELNNENRKLQLAVHVLKQNKANTDQKVESLINAGLAAALNGEDPKKAGCRRCPMCEAEFSLDTPQDDFEIHVVEHFSFEESETLRHFDMVPDAYWSYSGNSLEEEENLSSLSK